MYVSPINNDIFAGCYPLYPYQMRLLYCSHSDRDHKRCRRAADRRSGQVTTIPRSKVVWLLVLFGITTIIILTTIFSLKSGYEGIYPYFYFLPILLLAYIFPRYSVYFTIGLGWIYLALVYTYGSYDVRLFAESSAVFYIFVTIGVLFSSKIDELNQTRKYQEIFSNSQAGIFSFDRETGKISEINEKGARCSGTNRMNCVHWHIPHLAG